MSFRIEIPWFSNKYDGTIKIYQVPISNSNFKNNKSWNFSIRQFQISINILSFLRKHISPHLFAYQLENIEFLNIEYLWVCSNMPVDNDVCCFKIGLWVGLFITKFQPPFRVYVQINIWLITDNDWKNIYFTFWYLIAVCFPFYQNINK